MLSRGFWLALAASVLFLLAINVQVFKNEQLLSGGTVVRFELAPVDPRSLMQGDYMALRYALEDPVRAAMDETDRKRNFDGMVWVRLDANGVAQFVAIDKGQAMDEAELKGAIRLQFRKRDDAIKLASNAWFFEEGRAEHFEQAKYGEFRVDADGRVLLAAMLDEAFRPL